jgi:hypothetical protein
MAVNGLHDIRATFNEQLTEQTGKHTPVLFAVRIVAVFRITRWYYHLWLLTNYKAVRSVLCTNAFAFERTDALLLHSRIATAI